MKFLFKSSMLILIFLCFSLDASATSAETPVDGLTEILKYTYDVTDTYGGIKHYTYTLYNGYKDSSGNIVVEDAEFFIVATDNSNYNIYPNLGNPQSHTIFCKASSDNVRLSSSILCEYVDSNGNVIQDTTYSTAVIQSAFSEALELLKPLNSTADLKEYLNQFLEEGESYEDVVAFFENDNYLYGCFSMGLNGSMENLSSISPNITIKAGLIPSDGTGIYLNRDTGYTNIPAYYILPFLFYSADETEPPFIETLPDDTEENYPADNAKKFICYREHKKPFISISTSRVGSSVFTWEVSDYPEFSNCFIEIRSTLLSGDSINGYKPITNDFYYYATLNESFKKPSQTSISTIPFSAGTATCLEKDVGDYFKTIKAYENIAVSCPIRMQVRVVSSDKQIYSNWVTFDFDISGQHLWTGFVDNNGNVVSENLSSSPDYDWNLDNNSGKYDYFSSGVSKNSTGSDGFNADFSGWLDSALNSVIKFPTLLSSCYSWLPSEIITLIGISLGMLVVIRIIGR